MNTSFRNKNYEYSLKKPYVKIQFGLFFKTPAI